MQTQLGGVTVWRISYISFPPHVALILKWTKRVEQWCNRRQIETPAHQTVMGVTPVRMPRLWTLRSIRRYNNSHRGERT